MRILVVQESDWLKRNPVQQHHMLERLSVQGHEVTVLDYPICWRDGGGPPFSRRVVHKRVARVVPSANVTVIRTAGLRVPGLGKLVWLVSNTIEMARIFMSGWPDVVVVLGLSNGLVAVVLGRLTGVPTVAHLIDALHALVEPPWLRPIAAAFERAVLRGADRVVVTNRALGAYASSMVPGKVAPEIVPTGVDVGNLRDSSREHVRAQYGIRPQDGVMLFVGWLYPFCGLREVAMAMARRPDLATLRLLVVGDGDLATELQRLRDVELGDRIILAGQQPFCRVPEFIAAADICLLPSVRNETVDHIVPAKLYEYLAAGKPVIASRLPGVVAELGHGVGIDYVDTPEAVVDLATRLILDPAELGRRAEVARRAAMTAPSWDDVSARFLTILESATLRGRVTEHAGPRLRGSA